MLKFKMEFIYNFLLKQNLHVIIFEHTLLQALRTQVLYY